MVYSEIRVSHSNEILRVAKNKKCYVAVQLQSVVKNSSVWLVKMLEVVKKNRFSDFFN